MSSLRESGKPLAEQKIKELKSLEMMSSPYSQSLQGMIKSIEKSVEENERERPSSKTSKRKKRFNTSDGMRSEEA